MTRRDDEMLRDALLELEHAGPTPEPPALRSRRDPRLVWAFGGATAAAAVVLGAVLASSLADERRGTGEASLVPSATSTATPETTTGPSASPRTTAPPATDDATPAPTAEPTPGAIVQWEQVAEFGTEGSAEETKDVTYAAGTFIAIGYREPLDQRGAVGPAQDTPLIWTSAHGRDWERVEVGSEFLHAHLTSIVPLPDGSAAIYGWVDAGKGSAPLTFSAWRSADGRTWAPMPLDLPDDALASRVVAGPRGYLTSVDSLPMQLWHSLDGVSWRSVHTFVWSEDGDQEHVQSFDAGAEGFVVTGSRYDGSVDGENPAPIVMASSDGATWFEADAARVPTAPNLLVAPVGGDWMMLAGEYESSSVSAWFSANGLAWEERGSFEVAIPPEPDFTVGATVGSLVSTGDRFIATGAVVACCHGPWWASGVWSSFDGNAWESLAFPANTAIAGAITHDDLTVLAGFGGAGPDALWQARATFWIGERD